MEEKLNRIFKEVIQELNKIGIDMLDYEKVGKIEIKISKRNNKRYGCCKQEEPDKKFIKVEYKGFRKYIKYEKFKKHVIEISPWVMELDEKIIKNTIIHELIHCIPFCNNHGIEFKKYAKYINEKLGYEVSRAGNVKEDYIKSNIEFSEEEKYKYKIKCNNCGQEFFRKRLNKNFIKKYRCAKCNGKFEILVI